MRVTRAGGVLAGQDAAVVVVRVAVGHVARFAEYRESIRLAPAEHPIAGDVTEREVLLARMPDGALGEAEPVGQGIQREIARNDVEKPVVSYLDVQG